MPPHTDAPACETHDRAARFRRLCWPLLSTVVRTAQCLVRDPHQAEDLAQETMMKAMKAIDQFQDGTNVKAWLLTILRRTHIDHCRTDQRHIQPLSFEQAASHLPHQQAFDPQDPNALDPGDLAGEHDAAWQSHTSPELLMQRFDDETVIEALQNLPDNMRWTLLFVDVEQMSHEEAASLLGVAVGTIKSRAHRARALLRDHLYDLAAQRGWVPKKESA